MDEYAELESRIDHLEGLLLWYLYHDKGGNADVTLPIRNALGFGRFDVLTDEMINRAKLAAGI